MVIHFLNILKTGVLTALATLARLLSGFIVMKLVAVLAGPEGVAQFGQFMSLAALLVVFAGGGIGPGVIKYLAEFQGDDVRRVELLRSAFCFTLIASIAMCVLVLLSSKLIAVWLLDDDGLQWLIIILAVVQIFVALHNLIIATVNGMMDVGRLAVIHVCGAIAGVSLPIVLGYFFNLEGVLLAFLLAQASLLLISFTAYKRSHYFSWSNIGWEISSERFVELARFSLMTLTSALMAPVIQIAVRTHLAEKFSWEEVGYWQAVSKISEAYLLFFTMAISVYYLPKLSSISKRNALTHEIRVGFLVVIPLVVLSALLMYLGREVVIGVLFTADFMGALDLFAPQLIGDVLKIAAFMLSYVMVAKAMTRIFLLSEILFGLTYFSLMILLTEKFGLIGSMYAFIINYAIYLIFCFVVTLLYVKKMPA